MTSIEIRSLAKKTMWMGHQVNSVGQTQISSASPSTRHLQSVVSSLQREGGGKVQVISANPADAVNESRNEIRREGRKPSSSLLSLDLLSLIEGGRRE